MPDEDKTVVRPIVSDTLTDYEIRWVPVINTTVRPIAKDIAQDKPHLFDHCFRGQMMAYWAWGLFRRIEINGSGWEPFDRLSLTAWNIPVQNADGAIVSAPDSRDWGQAHVTEFGLFSVFSPQMPLFEAPKPSGLKPFYIQAECLHKSVRKVYLSDGVDGFFKR